MRPIRRTIAIFCICFFLPTWIPAAQAQDTTKQTEQLVDAYIGVMTMAYPPAGMALGAAKSMMGMLGFFDRPDLVAQAIKLISERLTTLEKRVNDIEDQVSNLRSDLFRTQNLARIRELKNHQRELQSLVFRLKTMPTDHATKISLAEDARLIANTFLEDKDLWQWSDMSLKDHTWHGRSIKAGEMVDADFKPLPALDYYVTALAVWIATIEYAGNGDTSFVKRTYGPALEKHIAYLSERPGWNELNDAPETLPENIKKRVSCYMEPASDRPRNQTCTFRQFCDDEMTRTRTVVASGDYTVARGTELCTLPVSNKLGPDEEELERAYGTEAMALLVTKLTRLRDVGTVRPPFTGTFDPTLYTAEYIYAVNPKGELLWFRHRVGIKPAGEPPAPATDKGVPIEVKQGINSTSGTVTLEPRHPGGAGGDTIEKPKVTHFLDGPVRVGTGWSNLLAVIPAGQNGIYAVTQEGMLKWFRHDGFLDGSFKWLGPKDVGRGWGDAKQIIPMGDGVIYVITKDGKLNWYRHVAYLDGRGLESPGAWEGPKEVGHGWGDVDQAFAGGEGVIYAITGDGILKWYHHKTYLTGTVDWEIAKEVGKGWSGLKSVFSPGEGVIYALKPTGELVWYKHKGYKDGSFNWDGPVQIASDWKDFVFVFPRMKGTWIPPVVR